MTTPRIPRGLRLVTSNYSAGDPGGVRRTAVAGGAPRYAQDYARGTQQFRASMILTAPQYAIWTLFYMHKIGRGAIGFEMDLDSGQGVRAHVCNIVPGSYSAEPAGGRVWTITFVLEAEPSVYEFDEESASDVLELWDEVGPDLDALLRRLARFALSDTRVLEF
ncbi:hypothetical protein [Pseudacidovorax sp. RU35E]|uniref:hypothetical protein n=1 Tax=Pseudacidovorax sp. RU35E TaxID=1907403 RepID=UPI0009543436|nr:hypothetical protein [Pseudacidovorax sp. RU35E]SIQ99714.1 hypothetical protein SAMN05880557_10774 [Pseudacidovorax sp. RU35E]